MNRKESSEVNNSLKLIVKTSVIVFLFLILSKVFTYIYRIVIARNFGPEIYGLFSLSIMIMGWFVAIFSFGLVDGIVRYISFYRGQKKLDKAYYIINVTSVFLLVTSVIAAILLFSLAPIISIKIFHDEKLIIFLKWFAIFIPFSIFTSMFVSILQSFEKVNWYSFVRYVVDNASKLIFLLLFVFLGLKTNAVIFSYIAGIAGMFIVSYFVCYKLNVFSQNQILKDEEKIKIRKELFSYSFPLIFVSIISVLFIWTDSFVIGYFRNVSEVGIYNSATPIAALFIIAPSLFIALFFTLINKHFGKKQISTVREISKQTTKWIFLINLPLLILILLFPDAFINIIFGPQYILQKATFFGLTFTESGMSLRFLAIGMFFYSIFIISENLLSMAGKSKIVLFDITIAALFNLILNILLIPKYGITGAAFATMLTYIIWSILTIIQTKYYLSIIPLKRKMIYILLISIIPTILLFFVRSFIKINILTLALQTIFFFLIYFLLIVLIKGFDENDLLIINSIKKKLLRN